MWKDWLERTLTRNKSPVMLAAEIMCEAANTNDAMLALAPPASPLSDRAEQKPEPAEV